MNSDTTIAAIATPAGTGAVAMLRVSGPGALAVAGTVFRGRHGSGFPPRRALYGSLTAADGSVLDDVLLTFFRGPASFTGEDTVEIACHGGVLVTRRILQRLLEAGAQPAGPGEFTRRAFLNGRMDLTQAEAVMDIISAQTDLALRAAHRQLEGSLGQSILSLRDDLLGVVAHVEAYIDFPEEDIDPDTGHALRTRLEEIRARITRLLATAEEGRILREGLRTVIAGAPNAGKSSLLNRLLGFERAIVSDIAGTTRDTIEEVISLRGFPLRLVDTAGLRDDAPDAIERAGVDRTRRQLDTADLVIEVVDASQPAAAPLATASRHRVLVLNKSDLDRHADWAGADGVPLSCQTGDGLEALSERIVALITAGGDALASGEVAVNARHKTCLDQAAAALTAAVAAFDAGTAPEFVAMDLRLAMEKLGEVVGRLDVEDLLGVIFSQFCIGK